MGDNLGNEAVESSDSEGKCNSSCGGDKMQSVAVRDTVGFKREHKKYLKAKILRVFPEPQGQEQVLKVALGSDQRL